MQRVKEFFNRPLSFEQFIESAKNNTLTAVQLQRYINSGGSINAA